MAGREPGAHPYAMCALLASVCTHGARGQRQPESRPGLARSVLLPKIDCPDVFHARTGVLISNSQDAAAFCLLEVSQTSRRPRAGFVQASQGRSLPLRPEGLSRAGQDGPGQVDHNFVSTGGSQLREQVDHNFVSTGGSKIREQVDQIFVSRWITIS